MLRLIWEEMYQRVGIEYSLQKRGKIMGKKTFWQSLRKNKWLASTGMLAAGALAVYGVWQMPSMNQYHMEMLDTPMPDESGEKQAEDFNSNVQNGLELPKDQAADDLAGNAQETADASDAVSGNQPEGTEEQAAAGEKEEEQKQEAEQTGGKKKKQQDVSKKKEDSVEVLSNPQSVLDAGNFDESAGLSWPIEGDVILNYDTEGVVYFQTLAQYKANPAIMIAGEVGKKVRAAADGVVEEIRKDEETGITLKIAAGNSYEMLYGQLQDIQVSEGDSVKEGAVLGKLAEPTDYFTVEGPNLYFQVLQKDTPVNPLLLLK